MSDLGNIQVSEEAIKKAIHAFIYESNGVSNASSNPQKNVELSFIEEGLNVHLTVNINQGVHIVKTIHALQERIVSQLHTIFGIHVTQVNVSVKQVA